MLCVGPRVNQGFAGKTNYAQPLFAKTREIHGLAGSSEPLCRLAVAKNDEPAFSICALPPPTAYKQTHNFNPWPARTYVRSNSDRIMRFAWGRAHNSGFWTALVTNALPHAKYNLHHSYAEGEGDRSMFSADDFRQIQRH